MSIAGERHPVAVRPVALSGATGATGVPTTSTRSLAPSTHELAAVLADPPRRIA